MKKITKDKLNRIIKEVLGVELTDDLAMSAVAGWDSLRHLQLIAKIEEVFKIEIDFKDTLAMTNAKSIIKVLEKYVGKK